MCATPGTEGERAAGGAPAAGRPTERAAGAARTPIPAGPGIDIYSSLVHMDSYSYRRAHAGSEQRREHSEQI